VSDLLSDNLFYGSFTTYQGRQFRSLFENISMLGLYLNQTRRLNWGVGAFRFKGNQYDSNFGVDYTENTAGAFGLLRYPLSRFARVEGQLGLAYSDRFDFTLPVAEPRRQGWIVSQYLSYVHDNALWTAIGPIDGHRFSVTAGAASDITNARFDSYTAILDGREYIRVGRRSALAVRGLTFWSNGDRPERVNLGGSLALRGYPIYGYVVGSRAWMTNAELRFPLLDYFTLGTPVGAIRFPEVQAAFFLDAGRAWFPGEQRDLLGDWGVSFRLPLLPGFVLRLDWGRRFTDRHFEGYGLSDDQKRRSFVYLFFGYNF
jgi:outer membrane protein assembly factor BamA